MITPKEKDMITDAVHELYDEPKVEIVSPDNDKVKFWLHRLLSEKVKDLQVITEEINILNHQAQHFEKMQDCFKNSVIEEINLHFIELKWNYKIKEIKK